MLDLGGAGRRCLPSCLPRLKLWRFLFYVDMIRAREGVVLVVDAMVDKTPIGSGPTGTGRAARFRC